MEKVAVVVTVLNEENSIQKLLDSLVNQSVKPQEIILVDGGSTDKTVEIVKKYKQVKLFIKSGNRSVGRNWGVAQAKAEIIAFTDAGCIPHGDWLEKLTQPFMNKSVNIVSGYYEGLAKNTFQKCLVPYVLVMPDKIPTEFFPSSRSMAIRRKVFLKIGGFGENLDPSEDFELANRLKKSGYSFYFSRQAIVSWIPRQNLKEAIFMFFNFAKGDIRAGIFRPKVKLLILRYILFFSLILINKLFIFLTIPYLIWAIWKNYRYVKKPGAPFWLPILQISSDMAIICGTLL